MNEDDVKNTTGNSDDNVNNSADEQFLNTEDAVEDTTADGEILDPKSANSLKVEFRTVEDVMEESFFRYSMSVIVDRALPDVRDGLKPVHRRILYTMERNGWRPGTKFVKSARIVGDVMGKYHPHGDSAISDTMVRMAQPWSLRYCLIDGQGNFGSIDGDNAAAMRYTEARVFELGELMLADIEEETVDMRGNFDDSRQEPVVLPSRVPALLLNGSSGIAVGMATNIPPHNLREVIAGTIAKIDNPAPDAPSRHKSRCRRAGDIYP